jgi:hypothetical protein
VHFSGINFQETLQQFLTVKSSVKCQNILFGLCPSQEIKLSCPTAQVVHPTIDFDLILNYFFSFQGGCVPSASDCCLKTSEETEEKLALPC